MREMASKDLNDIHQSHLMKSTDSASFSERCSENEDNSKHMESLKISSSQSSKPRLSLQSKGSGKSQKSSLGFVEYKNTVDDDGDPGIFQATVRPDSRRSNGKSYSSRLWKHKKQKNEINRSDIEREFSTDDQDGEECHLKSSIDGASDGEDTVNETSLEETSFNTSVFSERGNESSSELSIDPVIWKKFKFLSSILKETQHNLRAMDNLILEHRRLQDLADKNREHTIMDQLSIPVHQGLGDGEPKTDEAKLEEILSLLHNLTHTLASYEQHPLLASTFHPTRTNTTSGGLGSIHQKHIQQTSHQLQTEHVEPNSHDLHGQHLTNVRHTCNHHPTHSQNLPPPVWQGNDTQDEELINKSIDGYDISAKWSNFTDVSTASLDMVSLKYSTCGNGPHETVSHSCDPAYTSVGLLGIQHDATRSVYSDFSPHCSMTEGHIEKTAWGSDIHATSSNVSQYSKSFTKDSISQVIPSISEGHPVSTNTHVFYSQTGYLGGGLDNLHGQDSSHHPLMKETRSLRKDIDDIVMRKQVLDSRLQSLIAHRATQKELELKQLETSNGRHVHLMRSRSLEEIDNRRLRAKIKKYKSRSKSYEEKTHHQKKSSTSIGETYLSMIDEDQDEFPSLKMESLEAGEKITELQNEEADLPGLGDSGLSSEINSINATIQELVRENHQLHKFLQGMTSESILKVDQEKLALEAQIHLLNEENKALKISLEVDDNGEPEKVKQTNKAVSFLVAQSDNKDLEDTRSINTVGKTNEVKGEDNGELSHEGFNHSDTNLVNHTQSAEKVDSEKKNIGEEAQHNAEYQAPAETDSTVSLRSEVTHLNQENQNLLKMIIEERKINEEQKQLIREHQSQSDIKKDALEIQTVSKDSIFVEEVDDSKEREKLQLKIKKLMEEKDELSSKLSEEVFERDLESARLEARIRILCEQNQNLTQKLDEVKVKSKVDKDEKGCQSQLVTSSGNCIIDDDNSIVTVTVSKVGVEDTNSQQASDPLNGAEVVINSSSAVRTLSLPSIESHEAVVTCASDITDKKIADDSVVIVTDSVTPGTTSDEIIVKGSFDNSFRIPVSNGKVHFHSNSVDVQKSNRNINNTIPDDILHVTNGGSVSSFINIPVVNETTKDNLEATSVITDCHGSDSDNLTSRSQVTVLSDEYKGTCMNFPKADDSAKTSARTENIPGPICKEDSRMDDTKLILQLRELLKQNEVLTSGLNDLKSSAVTSETNLESTIIRVMEKHGKLIQNIDEKLTHVTSSHKSEYESRLSKYSKENQELIDTLKKQSEKVELLVSQNTSLEKKLQLARAGSKEKCSVDEEAGASCDTTSREFYTSNVGTHAHQEEQINQDTKDVIKESAEEIIMNTTSDEDQNQDSEFLSVKNLKTETAGRTAICTDSALEGKMKFSAKESSEQLNAQAQLSNPQENSKSQESGDHGEDSAQQLPRPQSSNQGPLVAEKEGALVGKDERYDLESEGILTLTFRREKENWTRLLEQAEKEKQILQERIIALVNENDCLAARLEEVVGVSRNLSDQMHSAKEQLVKVTAEKEDLQKRIRSFEDGKDDISLTLSDSVGSSQLTQRLKEQTRNLQSEVQRAWQEVHQRTIERDKINAEKESLEHTSSISLSTAKKEVETLKSQITVLLEEKNRKSFELETTQNELERKSADVRAVKDDNESQWERLMEADRKIESLQIVFKKGQEQLQKEVDERKHVQIQLEEIKKEKASSASLPPMAAGAESVHTRGERYWLETVTHLKGQLQQEQLRSRLLEAADHENSARILILQRSVRETIEAHENLQLPPLSVVNGFS